MEKPVALLINPPVYDFALFDLFHKPLGLMKIGRWLQEAGYQIEVVDALTYLDDSSSKELGVPRRQANGTGKFFKQPAPFPSERAGTPEIQRRFSRYGIVPGSLENRISLTRPDIVLITSGMTYWYPGVVEVVDLIRKTWPGTPVVVGGIYATLLPDHCERTAGPDYVVAGEPWVRMARILGELGLPVPTAESCRQVLPESEVWRGAGVIRLNEGCPMNCDYCASRLISPYFRGGDPSAALENLRHLSGRCGVRSFALYDDALLYQKESALVPFLEGVIDLDLDLSFYVPNALHLKFLDLDTARLMRRAGFKEVRLGYESSSPEFHQRHDAKVAEQDLARAISILIEAGFAADEIITYILAGMPGQRSSEVEETINQVSRYGVRISVAEYSPVPGTALWGESVAVSRYPIGEEPLYQNNSIVPMEWDGLNRQDMQNLKDLAHRLSSRDVH